MANDFNFSRAPFENERLPRFAFMLTAALVLGVTLVHGFFLARSLVREQEALDMIVAELEQELEATDDAISRTEASLARQQTALANERTEFLTRIYRHKGFSWTGLFNELEEITPAAVRITSIAPFEVDGEIAVTMNVVGRTLTNVLEMVSALEASSIFATVFPLEEVDLAELGDGRETGIAATLELRYLAPPPVDSDESSEADDRPDDRDVELLDEDEELREPTPPRPRSKS
jgi:Tfp pilus assembly protein PilN